MTDERLTRNLKYTALTVLSLMLGAVVYLFLAKIKLVVVILIGATFFAYLIYPAVNWLQRRRLPRWAAISVVYLSVIIVIAGGSAFVGPIIGDQAQNLTREVPNLVRESRDAIINANVSVLAAVPIEARQAAANSLDSIVGQIQTAAGVIAGQALKVAASIVGIITTMILIPLLAFYILLDLGHLREIVVGLFPLRHRERTLSVLADVDSVIGGFVRGQLLVGAVVAILVTIMLTAFRVHYALLIGIFAGIVDIIPYVGAVAGAVPAVILEAFQFGPLWALGVAIGFFILYELEGHIIAPAIVGQRVGLTPLMVIVAVLIGAELGGIGGMFLSVPIAGIIKVLWRRFMRPPIIAPTEKEITPESAAM
jgi:predicted PurR-regulated permease PerM